MTVIAWTPNDDFEQRLGDAFYAGNQNECFALLRETELALPTSQAAHENLEPHRWATYDLDGRRWIIAFTSVESMRAASDGVMAYARIAILDEIAAGWPDQTWGLAINPGLDVRFTLESGAVARIAAPSLEDFHQADPSFDAVLQKVLALHDLEALLDNDLGTVSGYVHPVWDTAHLASPHALLSALALDEGEHVHSNGSLFILRWRPITLSLYLPAYGGQNTQQRDVVAGSIVEIDPFVGLGFGRNRDQLIHEHKAMRAPLATGTELWELTLDGEYIRRAILDRSLGRWRLVGKPADFDTSQSPVSAATTGGLRSGGELAKDTGRFVARFKGTDYSASPYSDGDAVLLELRGETAEVIDAVNVEACEAVHYERPVCTWNDASFAVVQDLGEHLFVEYLGNNALEAQDLGLQRDEHGVYRGVIERSAARSFRQEIVPVKVPESL